MRACLRVTTGASAVVVDALSFAHRYTGNGVSGARVAVAQEHIAGGLLETTLVDEGRNTAAFLRLVRRGLRRLLAPAQQRGGKHHHGARHGDTLAKVRSSLAYNWCDQSPSSSALCLSLGRIFHLRAPPICSRRRFSARAS